MDFNGNVCTRQCGQTEVPWSGAVVNGFRKNCCRLNEEENGSRMSCDSSESANSRDFARNRPGDPQCQKAGRQSRNYAAMREHERGGGNACDGTALNFNDENVWPSGSCANCKIGFDLSSQRAACEKKCDEDTKHNVSFKRCYESINQMWNKTRRKRTNPYSALKKNIQERKGNDPNHRCTFENCYGNCDTYVIEVSGSECDQCQNCENLDFGSSNAYFEDCCCSHDPKPCSSNVSEHSVKRVHRVCGNCTENVKCCSPREPECDLCASSKHCLQCTHFTKPCHSCCSFCSRKCSPSGASLFVEIGSSVADLQCLRSGQVFRLCNDSAESLGDGLARRESEPVKRKKSDLLKTRSKPKKRADASERKCNPICRTQPAATGRSFSDKIECPEKDCDAIEKQGDKKACKRKSAHKLSSCSLQQPFSLKPGTVCFDTKKTDCWQQCEGYERSMWEEIRKGKSWLQDSCKNFLKTAAMSINQLVKQSSRGKLFKKCTRKPDKCEASDHTAVCANEGCLSNCLRESVCWTEMVTNESMDCNGHCCQNACCTINEDSNMTGVSQCPKYEHYNYCQTAREGGQHICPSDRDLCDDRQRCTGFGIRERGGSDSSGNHQRRKQPNSRDTSSTSSSYRGSTNSRNIPTQRQPSTEVNRSRGRQGQPVTTTIDSTIQASVTHLVMDPTTATQRNLVYQRRVVQMRQGDSAAPITQGGRPTTRQPSKGLPPARAASRTKEGLAIQDATATSGKPTTATADSAVQCDIITKTEVVCKPDGKELGIELAGSCACTPGTEVMDGDAAEQHSYYEISKEAIQGSEVDQFEPDITEPPIAESTAYETALDDSQDVEVVEAPQETVQDDSVAAEAVIGVVDESAGEPMEISDDSVIETAIDTVEVPDDTVEVTDDTVEVTDDTVLESAIDTVEVPDDSGVVSLTDAEEVPGGSSTPTELATTAGEDAPGVSTSKTTISKVTKEGRSVASIHMQTSSTILTKILSEFQIGNTRKRILMSIKLQTARDGATASFSSDSNGAEEGGKAKSTKTQKGTQKKTKRPTNSKSTTTKSASRSKTNEATDLSQCITPASSQRGEQRSRSRQEWSTKQDSLGFCCGPCGREKPLK